MLHMPGLLTQAQVQRLRAIAATGRFVDGRATAPTVGAGVKHNEQLEFTDAAVLEMGQMLWAALLANADFQLWAMPRTLRAPMINRHGPGMYYARHVDAPWMHTQAGILRTDISLTVFLSPPDTYEGGALCIETGDGERAIKLSPGDGFAYNTTVPHRVDKVTAGERLALVTWAQSIIRDPAQRAIIHQLSLAQRRAMALDPELGEQLTQGLGNLMRMWMDG